MLAVKKFLVCVLAILSLAWADEEGGVDERDAVIEFDESDELFALMTSRASTVVHLYSRKDP